MPRRAPQLRRDYCQRYLAVRLQNSLAAIRALLAGVLERLSRPLHEDQLARALEDEVVLLILVFCHVARLRVELRGATVLQTALGSGLPRHNCGSLHPVP